MFKYTVKINEATTNGNLIFVSQGPTTQYSFYSIERIDSYLDNYIYEDQSYFIIHISLDNKVNQYYRASYSFCDVLGYVGGIYGLLKGCGHLVFDFFAKHAFYSDLVSELYHAEDNCGDEKQCVSLRQTFQRCLSAQNRDLLNLNKSQLNLLCFVVQI